MKLVFLGLVALVYPAAAQQLDAIAGAPVRENRSVGITAAVYKGKEKLLLEAYGKADLETGAPMTVDTIIALGSTTKQFTAFAILQLQDQGKLTVDDEVTKWLPDFDPHGNKVTLRHLLAHTSGVTELIDVPEIRQLRPIGNPNVTRDEIYKLISRQPFKFPTGSMEVYTNTNFWLLGRIVEKASGMTYEDYVEKKVFEPLGMKRSMYCANGKDLERRARGHMTRNGNTRRIPEIVHTPIYAAGAICSTAEDMITWLQALHGGKALSAKSYKDMITPAKLNDGTPLRYSMGLSITEDTHGLPYIGHSGGGFGYSSEARWYTGAKLAIVVLTNSEPDEVTKVTEALAAAVLPPPSPAGPFKGDASQLTGTYKGPGRGGKDMTIEITGTPQGLASSMDGTTATPLTWVKDSTFRRGDALLIFRPTAKELRFDTGGGHFILMRP